MHSWPIFELTLRTSRLELRLPSDAELDVLARASVGRVLTPERMDHMLSSWSLLPSPVYERSFLQFHWGARAEWKPAKWGLHLVAFAGGEPIGCFGMDAQGFTEQRTVVTGSWLLPPWRGQGLGKEGRAAILELAFAGLGARAAQSAAHEDNAASLGVSDALGYERIAEEEATGPSGGTFTRIDVELTRERWEQRERIPVEVSGLDACRELFG